GTPFRLPQTRDGASVARPAPPPPSRSVRPPHAAPDHGGERHAPDRPDCVPAGPVVTGVRAGASAPPGPPAGRGGATGASATPPAYAPCASSLRWTATTSRRRCGASSRRPRRSSGVAAPQAMTPPPPRLLGSYATPRFTYGDVVECARRGEVQIVGHSAGARE